MPSGGRAQRATGESTSFSPEPSAAKRQSQCKWISWDDDGRPSCEHGPAFKQGLGWRCRMKHTLAVTKYAKTEAGKKTRDRANAHPESRSRKQLWELTRVR